MTRTNPIGCCYACIAPFHKTTKFVDNFLSYRATRRLAALLHKHLYNVATVYAENNGTQQTSDFGIAMCMLITVFAYISYKIVYKFTVWSYVPF